MECLAWGNDDVRSTLVGDARMLRLFVYVPYFVLLLYLASSPLSLTGLSAR